ncbi:MAG: arginase family protein [Bacteroidota bacterium]
MLDNWLSPLKRRQFSNFEHLSDHQLGKRISIYTDELPDLSKVKIALLGIGTKSANAVRKSLYTLTHSFGKLEIADLGNARKQDTSFLIPVLSELLVSGIFPIIIGDHPGQTLAQHLAYQSKQQLTNLVLVDEAVPLAAPTDEHPALMDNILDSRKPKIFNLAVLAYQSHFVPSTTIDTLEQYHFEHFRLGHIRDNIKEIEPLIRDADLLSFNLNSLRSSEAPGTAQPTPSGLFIEEACQISRYAGLSDKLTSIGFYGYRHDQDIRLQTAGVVAQMIWYFLFGYHQRKQDYPISTDGLVEYVVDLKKYDYQLTFWKSSKSGRWWMQIPVKTQKKHQRHRLIPCSYSDYQLACKNDLPDRLLNAYKRFG